MPRTSDEVRAAAQAVRAHMRDMINAHGGQTRYGTITTTSPLTIDVHGMDMEPLREDAGDFTVGDAVRMRQQRQTLKKGETLMLTYIPQGPSGGEWHAFDVLTDEDLSEQNFGAPFEGRYMLEDDDLYFAHSGPGGAFEGWTREGDPPPQLVRYGNVVMMYGNIGWLGSEDDGTPSSNYPYPPYKVILPGRIPQDFRPQSERRVVLFHDLSLDAWTRSYHAYWDSDPLGSAVFGDFYLDPKHTDGTANVDQLFGPQTPIDYNVLNWNATFPYVTDFT